MTSLILAAWTAPVGVAVMEATVSIFHHELGQIIDAAIRPSRSGIFHRVQ